MKVKLIGVEFHLRIEEFEGSGIDSGKAWLGRGFLILISQNLSYWNVEFLVDLQEGDG